MTTPILNVIEMGSIRNGKGADERGSETGTICCLSTTNQRNAASEGNSLSSRNRFRRSGGKEMSAVIIG